MARKSTKKSPVDAALDAAFKVHGNGVQINVMDLSPMFNEAKQLVHTKIAQSPTASAVLATDGIIPQSIVTDAMKEAIAKYRQN